MESNTLPNAVSLIAAADQLRLSVPRRTHLPWCIIRTAANDLSLEATFRQMRYLSTRDITTEQRTPLASRGRQHTLGGGEHHRHKVALFFSLRGECLRTVSADAQE